MYRAFSQNRHRAMACFLPTPAPSICPHSSIQFEQIPPNTSNHSASSNHAATLPTPTSAIANCIVPTARAGSTAAAEQLPKSAADVFPASSTTTATNIHASDPATAGPVSQTASKRAVHAAESDSGPESDPASNPNIRRERAKRAQW